MKKFIYMSLLFAAVFTSCSKWTEAENNTERFEKAALEDLKEKRDGAKWVAEAARTEENRRALEAYWEQLREYKAKAWLNTGREGGQMPMVYMWYDGPSWQPVKGFARGWLQSVPDSVVAISIWGGLGGLHPEELTANHKKDIEIFHKKGSAILMCWQTPSVGTGLPSYTEGKSGYQAFHAKYPFAECYAQWPEIYARELARYIISLDFDGYDIDWETCGDHGSVTKEGTPLMIEDNNYENIAKFVKEMAKYFGPVGTNHVAKTQAERENNLKALFDANTAGFHAKEKEFIEKLTPHLPANYFSKRYYLCADVPCGIAPIFGNSSTSPIVGENKFAIYFDKHFMQDYEHNGVNTSGSHPPMLGGPYYNSTTASYQKAIFHVLIQKGKDVRAGKVWGIGAYHGQSDYTISYDSHEDFKRYMRENNLTRKYLHYTWTREAIRLANPRPDYSGYKEMEPMIILP